MRHPTDASKSDNKSRWWPEWREIAWNKDKTFEFGALVIFTPHLKPDASKYSKLGMIFL